MIENDKLTRSTFEKLSTVKLVDRNEKYNLDLFNNDEMQKGVVFNNGNLVFGGLEFSKNLLESDVDLQNLDNYRFYNSYEGVFIHIFYFKDRWFVSMDKKLDIFSSRCVYCNNFMDALNYEYKTNTNFRERLDKQPTAATSVLDKFLSSLEKENDYIFLLLNTRETRLVNLVSEDPCIYHFGTVVFTDPTCLDTDDSIDMKKLSRKVFPTVQDLRKYVQSLDIQYSQGLICVSSDNKIFKIFNNRYYEYFNVRGTEPSIKFRYLQVRMDKKMTNMLYDMYSECIPMFEKYETALYEIAVLLYKSYVDRYIKKNRITLPKQEFHIINECHKWHFEDKVNNRISIDKIIEVLNLQTPTNLNQMIRRHMDKSKSREEYNHVRLLGVNK